MKNKLHIILILTFISCVNKTGEYRLVNKVFYSNTNQIKRIIKVNTERKKDSLTISYWPSDTLKKEWYVYYDKDNKRLDDITYYYENGNKEAVNRFVNKTEKGECYFYRKDETLQQELYFLDNRKDAVFINYTEKEEPIFLTHQISGTFFYKENYIHTAMEDKRYDTIFYQLPYLHDLQDTVEQNKAFEVKYSVPYIPLLTERSRRFNYRLIVELSKINDSKKSLLASDTLPIQYEYIHNYTIVDTGRYELCAVFFPEDISPIGANNRYDALECIKEIIVR